MKNTKQTVVSGEYPLHRNITVTVFWVGEEGNEENGYIPNISSAWDDNWMEHYGGVDDPDERDGFRPTAFVPLENPFYFTLPYNDFTEDGDRKAGAWKNVYWANEQQWDSLHSMCKNRWIEIRKGEKVAYAQWEDAGPFGEDDADYVFGTVVPENDINENAGLDVSPAVRDYLGLEDIDTVEWRFIREEEVPDGPWMEIVTTSQIDWE